MASIEKHGPGWRVVWRQGGIKQNERFATEADAEKFRALVKAHGERWPHGWLKGHGFTEDIRSSAPTFTEWATRCINARSTANDRTRHDYLRDFTRHLKPTFGDYPVDQITKEMVGAWLIQLGKPPAGDPAGRPLSVKTAKNVHNLASSIMAEAVEEHLVTTNPFRRQMRKLPQVRQEEMCFLERGEFDTLLSHVPEDYKPLVFLLGMTGLRWSEATALRVGDVDLMARRLSVVQAWKRTPESYFVIGEPKSRRSRRTIGIPPSLVDYLLPLVAGRAGSEFLFVTKYGRTVRHANFRARVWMPAVRAMQRCDTHRSADEPCGCVGTVAKSPRIHDLRHSHASWLIAAKVSLPAIQRRLGHESITTTIDRYGHLLPDSDDEIAAALDGTQEPEPVVCRHCGVAA